MGRAGLPPLPTHVNSMAVDGRGEVDDAQVRVHQDGPHRLYLFDFLVVILDAGAVDPPASDHMILRRFDRSEVLREALELVATCRDLVAQRIQALEDRLELWKKLVDLVERHVSVRRQLPKLVILSLACQACLAREPRARVMAEGAPTPDEVRLDGVRLERWVDDRLGYSARATTASIQRRTQLVTAKHVRIEGDRSTITADEASGVASGGKVTFNGHVLVVDDQGRRLETDRAIYDPQTDRLTAPGEVRLSGRNFVATGATLDAKLGLKTIDVDGPVQARFDEE